MNVRRPSCTKTSYIASLSILNATFIDEFSASSLEEAGQDSIQNLRGSMALPTPVLFYF